MAEGFEGSTFDRTFDRQKQVMSQIRHKLEMLHRVWMVRRMRRSTLSQEMADSLLNLTDYTHGSEMPKQHRAARRDSYRSGGRRYHCHSGHHRRRV